MKKTLMVLALASLPMLASAEVTLYGTIKGGLEYTKVKGVDNTISNVNDWDSFIGFKGYEKLNDSLDLIWQIEQAVSLDSKSNRNDSFANRDSFIGLRGSFGTIKAGYLSDTFKTDLETLDFWEGTGIRTLGQFTNYSNRYTAIRYDTPDFSGFSANVLYSPEDNNRYDQARSAGAIGTVNGFAKATPILNEVTDYKDILTIGLGYNANNFFANYAFKNAKNKIVQDQDAQAHGLQFGYDDGTYFAGIAYIHSKDYLGPDVKGDEGALSLGYTVGNFQPKLSLATGKAQQEINGYKGPKSKYTQAIIGADYNLSKRTAVVGSVGWRENKIDSVKGIEAYSAGLGLVHKF